MSSPHAESLAYAIKALKPFKPHIDAIYLYGSCARGEQTHSSDVDVFLRLRANTPPQIVQEMRAAVISTDHTMPEVELSVGTGPNFSSFHQFDKNLSKEAILLWERET